MRCSVIVSFTSRVILRRSLGSSWILCLNPIFLGNPKTRCRCSTFGRTSERWIARVSALRARQEGQIRALQVNGTPRLTSQASQRPAEPLRHLPVKARRLTPRTTTYDYRVPPSQPHFLISPRDRLWRLQSLEPARSFGTCDKTAPFCNFKRFTVGSLS